MLYVYTCIWLVAMQPGCCISFSITSFLESTYVTLVSGVVWDQGRTQDLKLGGGVGGGAKGKG